MNENMYVDPKFIYEEFEKENGNKCYPKMVIGRPGKGEKTYSVQMHEIPQFLIGAPGSGKTSELIRRGIVESTQYGLGTIVFLSERLDPGIEMWLAEQSVPYRILDFTDDSTLESFDFGCRHGEFYDMGLFVAHEYVRTVKNLIEQFGEYPLDLESGAILLALCQVAYYHKNLTLLEIYNLLTQPDYLQQQLERIPLVHKEFSLTDRQLLLNLIEAKNDCFKLGTKVPGKTLALRLHQLLSDILVLELLTPPKTPTLSCDDLCQRGQLTFITFPRRGGLVSTQDWMVTLLTKQIFLNQLFQKDFNDNSPVCLLFDEVHYYPILQKYISCHAREFRKIKLCVQMAAHSLQSIAEFMRGVEDCGPGVTFLSHPFEIPSSLRICHEYKNLLPSVDEWRRFHSLTLNPMVVHEARLAKQPLPLTPTPYLFKA